MEEKSKSHSKETIQLTLLEWYLKNKRDLPFRLDKDPYKIWVSEVMLQQTRVNAMLPSYEKFIKEIPDIDSLSRTDEMKVVSLWKGLGYYSRAKNLRLGAIYIKQNYKGKFPFDLEKVLSIPGIGPYTARAVLSIAYNLPHAVLDGNVKRVISRLFLFEENIGSPISHRKLQQLADELLNKNFPGDHNQALMELGATICTPIPTCNLCPITIHCLAKLNGKESTIPKNNKKEDRIELELRFYFLFDDSRKIMIFADKRRRFFKTIPSPPFLIFGNDLPDSYLESNNILAEQLKKIKKSILYLPKKHSITHHNIQLSMVIASIDDLREKPEEFVMIHIEDLEEKFPSSISKKLMGKIREERLFK